MEIPARIGNGGIGAIIAIIVIVFGVLIISEVLAPTAIVLGSLIVALGVARLT